MDGTGRHCRAVNVYGVVRVVAIGLSLVRRCGARLASRSRPCGLRGPVRAASPAGGPHARRAERAARRTRSRAWRMRKRSARLLIFRCYRDILYTVVQTSTSTPRDYRATVTRQSREVLWREASLLMSRRRPIGQTSARLVAAPERRVVAAPPRTPEVGCTTAALQRWNVAAAHSDARGAWQPVYMTW